MNKTKALCLIIGSLYLLQGMPKDVRAGFADIGSAIGNAADTVSKHSDEQKKNKKNKNSPQPEASDDE